MTRNNDPIEFLHKPGNSPPNPTPAADILPELADNNVVPEPFAETAKKDSQVFDAVTHGWYLYPLHTLTIDVDESTNPVTLAPTEDSPDLIQHHHTVDKDMQYAAEIETGWHISIDEDLVLLVQGPVYDPKHPVIPQVYTSTTDPIELRIPFHTTTPFHVEPPAPIVQVLPFPSDLLPGTEYTVSTHTDRIRAKLDKRDALSKRSDNPYEDSFRYAKPGSQIRTQAKNESAHHSENQ